MNAMGGSKKGEWGKDVERLSGCILNKMVEASLLWGVTLEQT